MNVDSPKAYTISNVDSSPAEMTTAWLEDAAITVTMRAIPAPDEGLWVALKDDAYTWP
jgi:hypothetical protein